MAAYLDKEKAQGLPAKSPSLLRSPLLSRTSQLKDPLQRASAAVVLRFFWVRGVSGSTANRLWSKDFLSPLRTATFFVRTNSMFRRSFYLIKGRLLFYILLLCSKARDSPSLRLPSIPTVTSSLTSLRPLGFDPNLDQELPLLTLRPLFVCS